MGCCVSLRTGSFMLIGFLNQRFTLDDSKSQSNKATASHFVSCQRILSLDKPKVAYCQ